VRRRFILYIDKDAEIFTLGVAGSFPQSEGRSAREGKAFSPHASHSCTSNHIAELIF
jgi:hypothetical protein